MKEYNSCIAHEDVLLDKLVSDAHNQSDLAFMFFVCFIVLLIVAIVMGYFENKEV